MATGEAAVAELADEAADEAVGAAGDIARRVGRCDAAVVAASQSAAEIEAVAVGIAGNAVTHGHRPRGVRPGDRPVLVVAADKAAEDHPGLHSAIETDRREGIRNRSRVVTDQTAGIGETVGGRTRIDDPSR